MSYNFDTDQCHFEKSFFLYADSYSIKEILLSPRVLLYVARLIAAIMIGVLWILPEKCSYNIQIGYTTFILLFFADLHIILQNKVYGKTAILLTSLPLYFALSIGYFNLNIYILLLCSIIMFFSMLFLLLYKHKVQYTEENITIKNGFVYSKRSNQLFSGTVFSYSDDSADPDGFLLEKQYTYEKGKLNGLYTEYYSLTGKIKVQGNYKNNKRTGDWYYYLSNGKICFKLPFKNGTLNGILEIYGKKQNILYKNQYKNGKKHGKCMGYFECGKIKFEENYNNDILEGEQIQYYENDQVKKTAYFEKGKQEGMGYTYYPNGKREEEDCFQNGVLMGVFKLYYDTGILKMEGAYKNNILDCTLRTYHPNGYLESEVCIKDDVAIHGVMYSIEGQKTKMNAAHLHNFMINLKQANIQIEER